MADRITLASRDSIAAGSNSFSTASMLLDARTRESVHNFYAWCRYCDDVIDGQVAGHGHVETAIGAHDRLGYLEAQTRAALAGRPTGHPAFSALARVADRQGLPAFVPFDILRGFRMDVDGRAYRSIEDLFAYCYGVAGAVGIGMAIVMGVRRDQRATLDRACDLGLAFQLTNIVRDVMADARAGRLYLPADLFGRERVTPAFVLDPVNRAQVAAASHTLLDLADRYYASARIGIAALPWRSAWAISTALGVYREIGERVRRSPDPWAGRQSVPGWRKLVHVAAGCAAPLAAAASFRRDPPRAGLWTRDPDADQDAMPTSSLAVSR